MNLYCPSHKTSSPEYIANYELVKWHRDEKDVNRESLPDEDDDELCDVPSVPR
jgi:hypothetical protein